MTTIAVKAYKNHRAGSRKNAVHRMYDKKGWEAATTYGRAHKLKATTLYQWISTWERDKKKAGAPKKKPAGTRSKKRAAHQAEVAASA